MKNIIIKTQKSASGFYTLCLVYCPNGQYFACGKKFIVCAIDCNGEPKLRNALARSDSRSYINKKFAELT